MSSISIKFSVRISSITAKWKKRCYTIPRFSLKWPLKIPSEHWLSALKFAFSLRRRCSLKLLLNRASILPPRLECALEPLTRSRFLTSALPLLPCSSSWNSSWLKSSIRKTHKTSIRWRSRASRENLSRSSEIPICDCGCIYGIHWTVWYPENISWSSINFIVLQFIFLSEIEI